MLGVHFSSDKEQVGSRVTILGIRYNFDAMTLTLTDDRRARLVEKLTSIQSGAVLSADTAAKLRGRLQIVSTHYRGRHGRAFLRPFHDAVGEVKDRDGRLARAVRNNKG